MQKSLESMGGSRIELPNALKSITEDQHRFFAVLKEMKNRIVELDLEVNPHLTIEQLPMPSMCGYTACAITEALRKKEEVLKAKVVFGYRKDGDKKRYHYLTSATVDEGEYAIDATYHPQFDPASDEQILIYPFRNLGEYGLHEYKKRDPFLESMDEETLRSLIMHRGMLPIRQQIKDIFLLGKYEELIKALN